MRHRSVKSRAGSFAAAAVLASALGGLGVTAAQAGFQLDLRTSTGTKSVTTTGAGQVITLQVWGQVTGTSSAGQGLQDAFFGVSNTPGASGVTGDLSAVTLLNPFNGISTSTGSSVTTSYGGTVQGTAGSKWVGSTDTSGATADGWVFARSTSMTTTGGSPITNGQEWELGTLTYTVASTGSAPATLNLIARPAANSLVVPAVWQQDGAEADGVPTVGSAVTISAQTGNVADINHDGVVNQLDLNIVTGNWLKNGVGAAGGDINGDGVVNQLDLNLVTGNWLKTSEPIGVAAALTAVPEPATLGLLGLGAMALIRRRRH